MIKGSLFVGSQNCHNSQKLTIHILLQLILALAIKPYALFPDTYIEWVG